MQLAEVFNWDMGDAFLLALVFAWLTSLFFKPDHRVPSEEIHEEDA